MSQDLEQYNKTSACFSLAKDELQEVIKYAELISKSGMIPKCYNGNAGAILLAWDLGASVGLTRIQSLQGIATVGSQASLWGDAALAVVMNSPHFVDIVEEDFPVIKANNTAVCSMHRRMANGEIKVIVRSFSWDDAITAKLVNKDNYKNHPWRMLQMRARARCMRDLFPDALKGLAIFEEVRDHMDTKVEVMVEKIEARGKIEEPQEIKKPWYKRIFSGAEDSAPLTAAVATVVPPIDSSYEVIEGDDTNGASTGEKIIIPIKKPIDKPPVIVGVDVGSKEGDKTAKVILDEKGNIKDVEVTEPQDHEILGFISQEQVATFWKWAEDKQIETMWILEQLKTHKKIDTVNELPEKEASSFCKFLAAEWEKKK